MPTVYVFSGANGSSTTVNLERDFGDVSVPELKRKISEAYTKANLAPEEITVVFADKQLEDKDGNGEDYYLDHYKLQNESSLFMTIRCHGGAGKSYDPKKHSHFNLTKTKDVCMQWDDPDAYRATMPCGHPVDPDALTGYSMNQAELGHTKIVCPVKECRKQWPYSEVRRKALLDSNEKKQMEKALSHNVTFHSAKKCPGCHCAVSRQHGNDASVICPICTKSNGSRYIFCWQCLRPWVGRLSSSSYKCGRSDCEDPAVKILKACGTIRLSEVKDVEVPACRACPNCGQLIEHDTKACKNIICPGCRIEFCYLCLKNTVSCLADNKPKGHFDICYVAPKQTSVPFKG